MSKFSSQIATRANLFITESPIIFGDFSKHLENATNLPFLNSYINYKTSNRLGVVNMKYIKDKFVYFLIKLPFYVATIFTIKQNCIQ